MLVAVFPPSSSAGSCVQLLPSQAPEALLAAAATVEPEGEGSAADGLAILAVEAANLAILPPTIAASVVLQLNQADDATEASQIAYLDGLIDALRDDLMLVDGDMLLDGFDGGKGLRLAPPKLLTPPMMGGKQHLGAVISSELFLASGLDGQNPVDTSSSPLSPTPFANVTRALGGMEVIVTISLPGAALSPIAIARLSAVPGLGGGVRVPAPLLLDVTPPMEMAMDAAEAVAAAKAERAAEVARADATTVKAKPPPKTWWWPRKARVQAAKSAEAKETEGAAEAKLSRALLAVKIEPEIPAKPITAVQRPDADMGREAGGAELIASISLSGAALCPLASSRLCTDSSGRGGGLRVPPPSLVDVTPPLEASTEAESQAAGRSELPAHEAEVDLSPMPIVNTKPLDAAAWHEVGSAELIASMTLSGAALSTIASARHGVRVPPPLLIDVTLPLDESEPIPSKAQASSAETPLSVYYEEIRIAAELAEAVAEVCDPKQLSLSSLLRATSSVDMLMSSLGLPETSSPSSVLSCPIAVARLSADGNGRGGGVRVAPPSLVDLSPSAAEVEAAAQLFNLGSDDFIHRPGPSGSQPGGNLPLRLGIFPRSAMAAGDSALAQDLPWESPRMSIDARRAAVSDLRSRTAENLQEDLVSPPPSPPAELTAVEYMSESSPPAELSAVEYMRDEEDDEEGGLSNGAGCSVPEGVALAVRSELRRLNGDAASACTGYVEMLGLIKQLVQRYRTHSNSAYATLSSIKPSDRSAPKDGTYATRSPRALPKSPSPDRDLTLTKEAADAVLPLILACEVELSLLGMTSSASPPTLLPDDLHGLVAAAVGGRQTRLHAAVRKGRWLSWVPRQRPGRVAVAAEEDEREDRRRNHDDKLILIQAADDSPSETAAAESIDAEVSTRVAWNDELEEPTVLRSPSRPATREATPIEPTLMLESCCEPAASAGADASLAVQGCHDATQVEPQPPQPLLLPSPSRPSVQIATAGSDVTRRPNTSGVHPAEHSPLRLGIYPRATTANAPTQPLGTSWESPRMSVDARLAAVSALRLRTAETVAAAEAEEATRQEVDRLASRISSLEEREEIKQQLEQRERELQDIQAENAVFFASRLQRRANRLVVTTRARISEGSAGSAASCVEAPNGGGDAQGNQAGVEPLVLKSVMSDELLDTLPTHSPQQLPTSGEQGKP